VRSIVGLLEGDITIDSELGRGTRRLESVPLSYAYTDTCCRG
jgi:chemotaxis protein histidine kinase CheA